MSLLPDLEIIIKGAVPLVASSLSAECYKTDRASTGVNAVLLLLHIPLAQPSRSHKACLALPADKRGGLSEQVALNDINRFHTQYPFSCGLQPPLKAALLPYGPACGLLKKRRCRTGVLFVRNSSLRGLHTHGTQSSPSGATREASKRRRPAMLALLD